MAAGGHRLRVTPHLLLSQIMMYEAELERAHGQMLEEMQAMEEEKNHAIEEAFSRAQVEMKAVHENLAGEEGAGGSQGCLTDVGCPHLPPALPRACRRPDQPADAAASAAHPHPRLQQPEASGPRLPPASPGDPAQRQGRGEPPQDHQPAPLHAR